jgi:hypothetical protein
VGGSAVGGSAVGCGAAITGVAAVSVTLGAGLQPASSASANIHNHGMEYLRIPECQSKLVIHQNSKDYVLDPMSFK